MVAQAAPPQPIREFDPLYKIPQQSQFKDAAGNDSDYLPASDLASIGDSLIRQYEDLTGLSSVSILYYWKRTSGTSKKKPILGKLERPSSRENFLEPSTYVCWLSASRCADAKLTTKQIHALLYHVLMHAEINANGKPGLRGPDAEIFFSELEHFGPWNKAISKAGAAIRQSSFFDDLPDVDTLDDEENEEDTPE